MLGKQYSVVYGSGIGMDFIWVIMRILWGLEMFVEPLKIEDIGDEDAQ